MKELCKSTGLFLVGLLACSFFALPAFSQGSLDPAPGAEEELKMDTTYSVLSIKDSDKMYQIGVWRRIDLREKYNLPFYGTGGLKTDGIIMNIYKAVIAGQMQVFADEEFENELDINDFKKECFTASDGTELFLIDANDEPFPPLSDLYYLDFREDFIFDKNRSEVRFDIKYITLVMPVETNVGIDEKVIAYIKYKDFYDYFSTKENGEWINFKNISKNLSYSEAFDLRLFRSVVRKYTNPENELIIDMIDPNDPNQKLQAYLKSIEFEYDLLEWENNLWEW